MAISGKNVASSSTLNELRTQFNNLVTDVTAIEGGTISFTALNTTTANTTTLNVKEDGTIIFEGATDDGFETTLTVVDPTADRTITLPNETGTVHTTGGDTTHTNIIIADGGNIGSASDTNAIGISSGGVVSVTATTANTSATDGALTVAGGLGVAADASIGDDLRLISDSAVLSFGADNDVTLTHVADTGILLNSTSVIQFNDASQNIGAPNATTLDINATDEVELNATLVDVNANLDVSGTYTGGGLMTTGGNIVIPDAGTIGSASDTDAISISSGGVVNVSATTASTNSTSGALTVAGGMGVAADLGVGDDLRMISDGAVISFGADSEITLTHVADTGLTLKHASGSDDSAPTFTLQTGDTDIASNDLLGAIQFQAPDEGAGTDAVLVAAGIDAISEGDFSSSSNATRLRFLTASSETASEKMSLSSSGLLTVSGRIITDDTTEATSTTDGSLQTDGGLSVAKDVVAGDDVKLLSDGAVLAFGADGDVTLTHVADTGLLLNGTSQLQFNDASQNITAASATVLDINATDEIELNATLIDVNANLDVSGTYSGGGLMTTGGNIVIPNAGNIGSADDPDAIAIGSDGDVTLTQDLELQHDGASIAFGTNDEITLTHVHDTGLLLEDSGGTPTLQLHDANESIASDGSKVIITSGGTAFSLPTADGSAGQVLKTNGSAVLSFTDVTASSLAADDLSAGDAAITLTTSSGNITIDAAANDSDIILKGTDGGADTTFLTIDGSDAGTAIFNHDIKIADDGQIGSASAADAMIISSGGIVTFKDDILIKDGGTIGSASDADAITIASDGAVTLTQALAGTSADFDGGVTIDNITIDGTEIDLSSGDLTLDVAGDIVLDAAGEEVIYKDGSTNVGHVSMDSDNLTIKSLVSDKDMIFQGNDGGTGITALTLDMSEAGAATFNNDVTAFSDERLKTEIETINDALNKVCQMRGVSFKRTDNDGRTSVGVIAQEIEKILPEVVREDKSEDKIKSVAYGNIVGVLIEAIKELKNEIEELKKE